MLPNVGNGGGQIQDDKPSDSRPADSGVIPPQPLLSPRTGMPAPDSTDEPRPKKSIPAPTQNGRTSNNEDPEPWESPVDIGDVVAEMIAILLKYTTFSDPEYALVVALWCIHTWLFDGDAWDRTGYLAFVSPTFGCGKTEAQTVAAALARRSSEPLTSPTAATIFRMMDTSQPTLFLDEMDGMREDSEVVGILNAGYKRGGAVPRMVKNEGGAWDLRNFSVFGPKCVAYIRDGKSTRAITDTLESRFIMISLQKRTKAEDSKAPRLRHRKLRDETHDIRRKLKRFANDMSGRNLSEDLGDKVIPEELYGRQGETWESLLIVAELAGVLPRAQTIAVRLARAHKEDEADRPDALLLADLRDNLDACCDEHGFSTQRACEVLNRLEERSYSAWTNRAGQVTGITPMTLSGKLKTFKLSGGRVLKSEKAGPDRERRILRSEIEQVLSRYAPTVEP
jgi:Protein of unknown function (DUF3631)